MPRRKADGQSILSVLSLEILLYFNWWYSLLFIVTNILVFAYKGYGCQTRILEELILVLRFHKFKIRYLLLSLSQKVGLLIFMIIKEILYLLLIFLFLHQAFGVFSSDFTRCYIFRALRIHNAQACIGKR